MLCEFKAAEKKKETLSSQHISPLVIHVCAQKLSKYFIFVVNIGFSETEIESISGREEGKTAVMLSNACHICTGSLS